MVAAFLALLRSSLAAGAQLHPQIFLHHCFIEIFINLNIFFLFSYNIGYDVDDSALQICANNFNEFEDFGSIELIKIDICSLHQIFYPNSNQQYSFNYNDSKALLAKSMQNNFHKKSKRKEKFNKTKSNSRMKNPNSSSHHHSDSEDEEEQISSDEEQKSISQQLHSSLSLSSTESTSTNQSSSSNQQSDSSSTISTRSFRPFVPPPIIDTIITNPPFGTRNKGIDLIFVQVGLQVFFFPISMICPSATFSLIFISSIFILIYFFIICLVMSQCCIFFAQKLHSFRYCSLGIFLEFTDRIRSYCRNEIRIEKFIQFS